VDTGERRPEDLRQVGGVEDDQAQHPRLEDAEHDPDLGQSVVDQQDDRDQRHVLEELGVHRREDTQRPHGAQPHQREQEPEHRRAGEARGGELERPQERVPQIRQIAAPVDLEESEWHRQLLPGLTGCVARASWSGGRRLGVASRSRGPA
jgi:hypothetical protein